MEQIKKIKKLIPNKIYKVNKIQRIHNRKI